MTGIHRDQLALTAKERVRDATCELLRVVAG